MNFRASCERICEGTTDNILFECANILSGGPRGAQSILSGDNRIRMHRKKAILHGLLFILNSTGI